MKTLLSLFIFLGSFSANAASNPTYQCDTLNLVNNQQIEGVIFSAEIQNNGDIAQINILLANPGSKISPLHKLTRSAQQANKYQSDASLQDLVVRFSILPKGHAAILEYYSMLPTPNGTTSRQAFVCELE